MRLRIGCAVIGLALAVSTMAVALAQADEDAPVADDSVPADTTVAAPLTDQSAPRMLFLQLVDPAQDDVEVPLGTAQLTVRGITLPGAVVSLDGNLADIDDQGGFVGLSPIEEGANEIEVVASDDQGNQITTTLFVVPRSMPIIFAMMSAPYRFGGTSDGGVPPVARTITLSKQGAMSEGGHGASKPRLYRRLWKRERPDSNGRIAR